MNKKEIDKKRIEIGKRRFFMRDFIKPIIVKSKIILDIGTHRGTEILSFYQWSPNVHVFGFEPNKDLFDDLEKKFSQDNNCNFYNLAISDINGEVDFYQDITSWADSSSLIKPTKKHTQRVHSDSVTSVQSSKLDTWYKQSGLGFIDFIWSDTEGSERGLINGGREALKNTKYFYAEYFEEEYYEGQALLTEIVELMESDFDVEGIFAKKDKKSKKWLYTGDILFKNKNL